MTHFSDRQRNYLARMAVGRTYDEIAAEFGVGVSAVRYAVSRAREAAGARTVYQLMALWAAQDKSAAE